MGKVLPLLGLFVAILSTIFVAQADQTAPDRELRIAFVGDPQIGYGDAWGDYLRFSKLVESINRNSPDVVIIPGDLVQSRTPLEDALFRRALSRIRPKVILAPGNHDVVDSASLSAYRSRFGPDYFIEEGKFVRFIVINSETARSPLIDSKEFSEQWTFIESALAKPSAPGKETVLIMHRPPFESTEQEPDSERGWPLETRGRLLSLCRKAGVSLILAGHLHETQQVLTSDGIEIRVLSGTARSFDQSPVGFEEIVVGEGKHRTEFRRVGPAAPPLPPSVPKLREWTPRILDFGWGHWGFTVLFLVAALWCQRAARARESQKGSRAQANLWGVASSLALFYAINMQLDVDEFLRELGRGFARVIGIFEIRHIITGAALLVLIALAGFATFSRGRAGTPKAQVFTIVALLVPTFRFVLSTISHHDLGMLFEEFTWDVLTLISLLVVFCMSQKEIRSIRR